MIDYKAILTAGIPDSKYHAATHVLSASGAKKLLACPARFKYERDHPPPEPKRAFDFGRLAHTLVLGEGSEIVVVDADNWTTKAAREQRDAAYAASATPVLRAEYDAALAMRDAVMAHPTASQLFAQGVAELSGFFEDDSTGIGLRFRPDFMTEVNGKPACIDFKTASSADPAEFARSVARYLYHLQNAWYIAGLNAHGIKGAAFYFVCAEKTPPYPVSVIQLDDEAVNEGRLLMRKAIDLYKQCADADDFPAYGTDIHTISLPMWALTEMEITI